MNNSISIAAPVGVISTSVAESGTYSKKTNKSCVHCCCLQDTSSIIGMSTIHTQAWARHFQKTPYWHPFTEKTAIFLYRASQFVSAPECLRHSLFRFVLRLF